MWPLSPGVLRFPRVQMTLEMDISWPRCTPAARFPFLLPWNLPFPAGSVCPPLTAGPFPSPRPALAALPSSPSFPLFAISLPVSDAYAAPSKCNSRICQNYFLKLPGRGGRFGWRGVI